MKIEFDHNGKRRTGAALGVSGMMIICSTHTEGRVSNLVVSREMAADPRTWDAAFDSLGGERDLVDEDGDPI